MDIERSLAVLRDAYVQSFDEKRRAFNVWAVQLATTDDPRSHGLEGLRSLAHKLAGSAGTYGFPDLAEAARRLESSIADAPKGAVSEPDFRAAVSRQIAEVCAHLSTPSDLDI